MQILLTNSAENNETMDIGILGLLVFHPVENQYR